MDQTGPNAVNIPAQSERLLCPEEWFEDCSSITQQSLKPELLRMLVQENCFQGHLEFSETKSDGSEIDSCIRDGSAHILRYLKMWYDLPSEVLFVAVNIMDRFLSKIKARPKHMACICVSAFHLACRQVAKYEVGTFEIPEPKDLIIISQCHCTLGDMARMKKIIISKLELENDVFPVTSLSFLRVFQTSLVIIANEMGIGAVYKRLVPPEKLQQYLEILVCDSACTNFRASEIALVLLCAQLYEGCESHRFLVDPSVDARIMRIAMLIMDLKSFCEISDTNFCCCTEAANTILKKYNSHTVMPHRQRLIWRLSQRTLKYLRPTNKLTSLLPTIYESSLLQFPGKSRCSSCSSDEYFSEEY